MAIFETKELEYAYSSLHDYFDFFSLPCSTAYLQKLIKAAASSRVLKEVAPYNVIFFLQNVKKLCRAAFVIDRSNSTRAAAILKYTEGASSPDIQDLKNFESPNFLAYAWTSFPRTLTAAQYQDPYKALHKFTSTHSLKQWKKIFDELLKYAFSQMTIIEPGEYGADDLFTINRRLLQMLEACHLLHIRTYKKNT